MKKCNNAKCTQINPQPFDNFFRDKNNKTDGRYSICKTCKQAGTMAWREKNKDKYNTYMREVNKERYPTSRLQRYNMTLEQHTSMLERQNNLCALCDKPPNGKRPLVVDHCHDTGKVRGLLCYGCNRLMVLLDSPKLLEKAVKYKAAA